MKLDRNELIGVIAKELNILISEDDPVFACVLLNEIVLNALVDRAIDRIETAITHAEKSIERSSERIEKSVTKASKICVYLDKTIKTIWWEVGSVATLVILVCLIIFAFLFPSILLSKQDQQQIIHGRMIEFVWDKLDLQTQDKISAIAQDKK